MTAAMLAPAAIAAFLFAQGISHQAWSQNAPGQDARSREALNRVNAALQAGQADQALALLQSLPQSGAGAAEAHNLECRVLYTLEQWNRAAGECEQAVKLDAENSGYHLWLARALGEQADRATFLSAYSLAKRVRAEFEEAVSLNPRNADALADLGEFYYSAPGAVGGGIDKAEKLAAQLEKVDAARAHELRGHIAEERKDYGTAEREYKASIASAAQPAFQWMTLAGFYRRRERWPEMESAVESGATAARRDNRSGVALYNGASVLEKANRDQALAAKMLEDYLAGAAKSEEAPAFEAHLRLARLKEQLGDHEAAQRERAAALALAHDYKPAQDAKH
jgi:tetratricopeptide (TPR) repeat protein